MKILIDFIDNYEEIYYNLIKLMLMQNEAFDKIK